MQASKLPVPSASAAAAGGAAPAVPPSTLPRVRQFAAQPGDTRPVLFISDLHLSAAIPRTVAAFTHFIETVARDARALFILGDLFEYWIGDDELASPWTATQCALMRGLTERGVELYVMRGNRDFLLGPRFAKAAGATLLDDPCTIEVFGKRIVLTHGDALCTLDAGYQRFRRWTRRRWVQRTFLAWPLAWRLALARKLRQRPMQIPSYNPAWDVTADAVAALFAASGCAALIHGHTHRPARHLEAAGERWVLPDWDLDHGIARGGYLQVDAGGIRALALPA